MRTKIITKISEWPCKLNELHIGDQFKSDKKDCNCIYEKETHVMGFIPVADVPIISAKVIHICEKCEFLFIPFGTSFHFIAHESVTRLDERL